jgi:hypothetical protein
MRLLLGLFLPLLIQVFAYIAVFLASQGGGSFMGLLAMPVAAVSVLALVGAGVRGARSARPLPAVMLTTFLIAVGPPILLLIFRALES